MKRYIHSAKALTQMDDWEIKKLGYKLVDNNYARGKDEYEYYKAKAIEKYGPETKVYRVKSDTPGLINYIVYAKGTEQPIHSSEDFVVDYPIRDEDPNTFIKRWAKREAEDEADYWDLTHNECKYAEVESSDHIPDTTERYPEGKKSYVDNDCADEPMQDTLENVINYLKEKYYEPYINEIEVFGKNGESELVTDSFDDVLQSYAVPSKMLCNDTVVDEESGRIEIYLA